MKYKTINVNNNNNLIDGAKSGVVFSVTCILPLVFSFVFLIIIQFVANGKADETTTAQQVIANFSKQNWFIYCNYLLSQLSFIAVAVFFLKKYKITPRALIIQKFSIKYLFIALLLSFGMLFSLSEVNTYFIKFLYKLGFKPIENTVPAMNNFGDYILNILIIAVLPAIFEETIFRGFILKGLSKTGTFTAAIICGFFFSLFHQSPVQTVYQFICGIIFALLVIRSGSVLPSIIMHFINNCFILTLNYINPNFALNGAIGIIVYILSTICLVCGLTFLIIGKREKKVESIKPFLLTSAPGIATCIVIWIAGLF